MSQQGRPRHWGPACSKLRPHPLPPRPAPCAGMRTARWERASTWPAPRAPCSAEAGRSRGAGGLHRNGGSAAACVGWPEQASPCGAGSSAWRARPAPAVGHMSKGSSCVLQEQQQRGRSRSPRRQPTGQQQQRRRRRTLSPTAALPCFTASIAYSIWKMRPCGLHVVTSVSYCAAAGGRAEGGRREGGRRAAAVAAVPGAASGGAIAPWRAGRDGPCRPPRGSSGAFSSGRSPQTWFLNILPLRRSRPPLVHPCSQSGARPSAQAASTRRALGGLPLEELAGGLGVAQAVEDRADGRDRAGGPRHDAAPLAAAAAAAAAA